ncbi:hypothetical protein N8J89_08045 [Crossiella sp. CA-258035]|uniref:hypothetical protein n=1 Tax=Crossiella sp. CA-258035 TaxID=2981138 RepID=UPI0024BD464A|nr:hypothetical protein [Crossiella sp. CA-258035]WHT21006.1 hypothetical protein N8J89_08045 [Crossiella sp. CA-258035]
MYRALVGGGLALLVLGLFLGIMLPESIPGSGTAIPCGTPWNPSYAAADDEAIVDRLTNGVQGASDYRAECRDAFGSRSSVAIMITILGGIGLAAAAVVRHQSAAGDQSKSEIGNELP